MGVNPDVILISPFKRGGYDALKDVDIPLIPHLGYKEMTPLGQAEWIKFVGLLTGTENKANRLFAEIEQKYQELKALAQGVKERPVVFSGELRGGNWYAVGGKSFLAQLFKDAGADYFLNDNEESGGVTLDFETVYEQAVHAQYWRIVNSYQGIFTYDVLKDDVERYADFRAFKENFKGATVIWLILLVPGCVILFNINAAWFVKVDTNSVANWLILISGILWIATAIYAFALQAAFENTPLRTVSNALRLVLVSPIRSLILVALFAGAIYCTYRFPFLVFVYTPFCVFLAARPVWGLFQKVMDLQEIPAETTNNSENEGE